MWQRRKTDCTPLMSALIANVLEEQPDAMKWLTSRGGVPIARFLNRNTMKWNYLYLIPTGDASKIEVPREGNWVPI